MSQRTEAVAAPQDAEQGGKARRTSRAQGVAWSLDVLVVDDDPGDTNLIVEALRQNPWVRSYTASDAPDLVLIQLAQGWLRPNLILLDLNMPRVTGFKFLEALRQIPRMQDTPVAFVTTSGFARDVEAARGTDVCSYLVKPSSLKELTLRIDALVKQILKGAWCS